MSKSSPQTIDITYYTDPLCCWSWAMKPVLSKLEAEFGDSIKWRICMGGLIPTWSTFSDPVNSVTRPLQMGPVWMHAANVTGVQMDHNLWFRDPPATSYIPCIAFKTVQLQSEECAAAFLTLMWEACMCDGINISKQEEVNKLAARLKPDYPVFDIDLFNNDMKNGNGSKAFLADIREVKANNINRFPTMIFRKPNHSSLIVSGYRPYAVLLDVIERFLGKDARKKQP